MGTLYLVRHGQASFGAADYDQLSALGHRQAVRLGAYWRERGMVFDAVITGTLKRHVQTWQGIAEGLQVRRDGVLPDAGPPQGGPAPSGGSEPHAVGSVGVVSMDNLNEYDSEALIATIHPGALDKPDTPERYRHHFRLLKDALAAWMDGRTAPRGMPSWLDFAGGVATALDHVRANHHGAKVLVVSSGGPISTAVGHVLQTPPATTVELNLRMRNTAVTEFAFTPKRHMLVTFNTLPHLDGPAYADWVTHA